MDFNYSDYLKQIAKNDIYLYGAGKYGQQALTELDAQGLSDKVLGFLETVSKSEHTCVCGKPVYGIDDIDIDFEQASIVITLAEKNQAKVRNLLTEKGALYVYNGLQLILDSYRVSESEWAENEARRTEYVSRMRDGKPDSKIKASHVTYPLVGNAGDTYLSWCVREYLGYGSWNIINASDEVTEATIDSINNTDICIIGGGGLFLPDTNANEISGWQWAISDDLLDKITVPIVIYSVGYNYFAGQTPSELFIGSLRHLVSRASFVGLRNHGSIEKIKALLPDDLKDKIVFQPCITTIMDHVVSSDIQHCCGITEQKDNLTIAVNMAFDRSDRRFGDSKEQILNELAASMKILYEKGHRIVFAAHCDKDVDFLKYLNAHGVGYIKRNLTRALPDEIMRFYRDEVDLVIGMRGHAQMIPYGLGKNIISLVSHDKMRWFLEDIGMDDCSVDLRIDISTIADRIIETFNRVLSDEKVSEKLFASRQNLFDISEKNKAVINNLLGEN